jgi:hypothetical protein
LLYRYLFFGICAITGFGQQSGTARFSIRYSPRHHLSCGANQP